MATLLLGFKKKILRRYALEKGASIVVGRRGSNHVVIDNAAVSDSHARIFSRGGEFYVEDLDSTNGTFVNNKSVKTRRLHDGDVIAIGRHELTVDLSGALDAEGPMAPPSVGAVASRDKTSSLSTVGYRKIIEKNVDDPNRATLFILRFKDRQLRKYLLRPDNPLSIGRLEDNDVLIENDAVSGHHARVVFRDDAFLLEDLGSTNGTFVNGEPITAHRLKDEDVVRIGKHELVFCEYEKYTLEETQLPYAPGQAFPKPSTTALDISRLKNTVDRSPGKGK